MSTYYQSNPTLKMTHNEEKTKRAYTFFIDAEKNNKVFTISDISEATEWEESTVKAYLSKKWFFLLKKSLVDFA